MKKLLLVLAIASFAACNDAGSGEEKTDSTATAPAPDTTAVAPAPDTTAVMPADTTKKDTTIKK